MSFTQFGRPTNDGLTYGISDVMLFGADKMTTRRLKKKKNRVGINRRISEKTDFIAAFIIFFFFYVFIPAR